MIRDRLPSGSSSVLALLLVTLLVSSMPVSAANAQPKIDYDAGPNPYVHEDGVEIAQYNRSEMSGLQYYGDDGSILDLPAHINSSEEMPFKFSFSSVSDDDLRKFPRNKENVSAIENESSWTTSGLTVAESSTSVEGVTISGVNGTATFDVADLSDAQKRVLLAALNVDTLDAGVTIEFRAVDADGDYAALSASPSGNVSDVGVVANAVGDGYVGQQKLADLAVAGTGDGSLTKISEIVVSIQSTTAGSTGGVTLTGLDVEKKSRIALGDVRVDEDSDGDNETVTRYEINSSGPIEITSLSSMGAWADDSTIHGLTIQNLIYSSADVAQDQVSVNFTSADEYGNYPSKLDFYSRLKVPTAIDLSHSGLELRAEQKFVSDRYIAVEYAENVNGDTNLTNVSDDKYADKSSTFTSKGAVHILDSSIQPGAYLQIHIKPLLLADEVRDIKDTSDYVEQNGGGGAATGQSGGILDWIGTKIAAIFALVAGFFKIKGWRGS